MLTTSELESSDETNGSTEVDLSTIVHKQSQRSDTLPTGHPQVLKMYE